VRIALGSDHAGYELKQRVRAWLEASYSGEERHRRRVEKISQIESGSG
jgi:ribose 5-phosphate isomerase RpiB